MQTLRAAYSLLLIIAGTVMAGEPVERPLFKDFMGVCGHTVLFKPVLYRPACRLVRDYHPIDWDFGDDTSYATQFPFARNRVEWKHVYGGWQKGGFETNVCLMFDNIKPGKWKSMQADAKAYGVAFAKYFGPGGQNIVTSAEIGNEPGEYDDAAYRKLFESMARGLREGDPKLKIATCNVIVGKSHKYAKSVDCFEGLAELFDVITTHTYAEAEPWPTWRRSFPEDPKIPYLKDVEKVIAWRDQHAPGKPVWITEFGWDATTQPNHKTGDFAKWIGNTETEQAQWLVRSFLVFSKMSVERAYIYFFNDKDEPQLHGSSGLTRNFKPKPAFHAVAHLHQLMGDYRFNRIIQETADAYAYEFAHGANGNKKIWAVWSPTWSKRNTEATLPVERARAVSAERMPLTADAAQKVETSLKDGKLTIPIGESPVYVSVEE